jgi:hypothetical protein
MAFTSADIAALEAARMKLMTGRLPSQMTLSDGSVIYNTVKLDELNAILALARAEAGTAVLRTVAGNVRRPGR